MGEQLSYNDAYAALEKLVSEIEDENIQLDSLADKVLLANQLIRYCSERLRNIEGDVQKIQMSS